MYKLFILIFLVFPLYSEDNYKFSLAPFGSILQHKSEIDEYTFMNGLLTSIEQHNTINNWHISYGLEYGYLHWYGKNDIPDTNAHSLNIICKGYGLPFNKRFNFSIGGGVGMLYAQPRTPPPGSHFNFNVFLDTTIYLKVYKNIGLYTGTRLYHLSNAALFSKARNPGYDSLLFFSGVTFTF
jgi:hypothetical protein